MTSAKALLFGITVAIAIGPIALLIMNVSANAGLGVGLRSAAGAAAADLTYALLAFAAGYQLAPAIRGTERSLDLIASIVLLCFGIWIILTALRQATPSGTDSRAVLKCPFLQTYVLTIVNPLTLVLFAGFAAQLPLADSLARVCWFAGLVALGSLLIQVTLALGGVALGRMVGRGYRLMALNILSGVGVAGFGAVGLYRWMTA